MGRARRGLLSLLAAGTQAAGRGPCRGRGGRRAEGRGRRMRGAVGPGGDGGAGLMAAAAEAALR